MTVWINHSYGIKRWWLRNAINCCYLNSQDRILEPISVRSRAKLALICQCLSIATKRACYTHMLHAHYKNVCCELTCVTMFYLITSSKIFTRVHTCRAVYLTKLFDRFYDTNIFSESTRKFHGLKYCLRHLCLLIRHQFWCYFMFIITWLVNSIFLLPKRENIL